MRRGIPYFSEVTKLVLLINDFWLLTSLVSSKAVPQMEENEIKTALLQLRDSLNYPNGSALINDWKIEVHYCGWVGIFCGTKNDSNSQILGLSLDSTREHKLGTWYPEASLFSHFKELIFLTLSSNYIAGFVKPEALCRLKDLQMLDLSNNYLAHENLPSCLCHNLSSLKYLDLSGNKLKSSNFLSGIRELDNLQMLNLGYNQIGGELPPYFGKLNSLFFLDLSHNHFNGSVSQLIISNLTSIQTLDLSDNMFSGIFSFSILANLSKLQDIDLSNNELEVETETPTWIPSFQLAYLNLMNCKLNKKNGHMIPNFISNQYKLRELSLAYNSLQGKIPSWLFYNNSPSSILSLRGNSFNDEFPVFSASFQYQISSLVLLDISDNNSFGQIPSNIGNLFPVLNYLNVSRNTLQGIIPLSLGNMSMLRVLDASFSFLNGKIPEKLRMNNTSLYQLILSDNNFRGEIMPVFSNMTKLAYLHLRNNGFIGTLSAPMVNMPILKVLEISGNQLSGNIPNLVADHPTLHVLLLARNDFHGGIPLSLCKMQNLHILDLSVNHLSGVLPSYLCNITAWKKGTEVSFISDMVFPVTYSDHKLNGSIRSYHWLPNISNDFRVKIPFRTKGNSMNYEGLPLSLMTGIDFSVNNLSGAIPSEIGELLMLRSLNLSCNNLTGKFPESFKNLKNLESLDLSHNHLVGTLPQELVQLYSLSTFSVAVNNLSGKIPYKNNFLTFNETSYIGNSGFCGLPLNDNCSVSRLPQIPDGHDKNDGEGIGESDLFFFSCVAVFYVLGFWAVIAPLILSRNWRRKYMKLFLVVD